MKHVRNIIPFVFWLKIAIILVKIKEEDGSQLFIDSKNKDPSVNCPNSIA